MSAPPNTAPEMTQQTVNTTPCSVDQPAVTTHSYRPLDRPVNAPARVTVSRFHLRYAKTAKPISAPSPWAMPISSACATPNGLPGSVSMTAAMVSPKKAAPGLRMMMATSGPANSHMKWKSPPSPGVRLSNRAVGTA